ncbi:MAG: hypothetical protein GY805_10765, partial [Chloroflexi bacterium]|nr:hypothetical protein [Chloroflexota bacterium]
NEAMSGNLLQTKLYVPRLRPFLIPRPHLIKKLNLGLQQGCKLTLVSAPAGFGKTTLIADWGTRIAESTTPHSEIRIPKLCWLSLDNTDNDPARFLTYFIAALQQIDPDIGQTAQVMLQSPAVANTAASLPVESLMTTLINDITAVSPHTHTCLILDDYHTITTPAIHNALTFFLV